MKRIEMIAKIEALISKQRQDLDNGSDYQDADAILYLVEKEGMVPPLTSIERNDVWTDHVHEWDEE